MTVKELMEQVDVDKVTEAFLLTFYLFHHDCYELSISEKFNAISKARELLSYNINLFKSCTPTTDGEKHTILLCMIKMMKILKIKRVKSFSCFAIHDEEAFSVLDKNFYLYTGEGETELSHYSFDHEKYVIWQLLQLQNHQLIPLEKKYVLQKFFRICSFGASILKTEKRTSINLKKDK